jgi:hypothetical protein
MPLVYQYESQRAKSTDNKGTEDPVFPAEQQPGDIHKTDLVILLSLAVVILVIHESNPVQSYGSKLSKAIGHATAPPTNAQCFVAMKFDYLKSDRKQAKGRGQLAPNCILVGK